MTTLEPFQFIFVAASSAWCVAQILPKNTIQEKIQGTAGLVLVMLGLSMTGLITIPQYGPEKTTITPVAMYDDKLGKAIALRDETMKDLGR
jgi:hypothetical protein